MGPAGDPPRAAIGRSNAGPDRLHPEAPPGHLTLHLLPVSRWEAWCADPDPAARYVPEGFEAEGFVHCTDGDEAMLAVANRFYAADAQAFVAIDLDLDLVDVPWRYDEPGSPYPHVYGPLRRDAVRGVRSVLRDAEGRFVGYGERGGIAGRDAAG